MSVSITSLREHLAAHTQNNRNHTHRHRYQQPPHHGRDKGKRHALRKLSRATVQRTVDFVVSSVFRAKKHRDQSSSLSDLSVVSPYGPLEEGAKEEGDVGRGNNDNSNATPTSSSNSNKTTVGVHQLPSITTQRSSLSFGLDFFAHGEFGASSAKPEESPVPVGSFNILPPELKMRILSYLGPLWLLKYSAVSREWRNMCLHGSLWKVIDTEELQFYMTSEKLLSLIVGAGPFLRELNIKGGEYMFGSSELAHIARSCPNITNLSIETACWYWELQLDLEGFIRRLEASHPTLRNITLSGSSAALHMGISRAISSQCTQLRRLDLSHTYHHHIGEEQGVLSARALQHVVESCPYLEDMVLPYSDFLRDRDLLLALYRTNKLSVLRISDLDMTEPALNLFFYGTSSYTTTLDAPPRRLRYLEVSRCDGVPGRALNNIVGLLPDLEVFILKECEVLDTSALSNLVHSFTRLKRLAFRSIIINAPFLHMLASAPCTATLRALEFEDALPITDDEAVPLIQNCPRLRALRLCDTNITDQTLVAVCDKVARAGRTDRPPIHRFMFTIHNCMKVSWAGIQQVLATNSGSNDWFKSLAARPHPRLAHPQYLPRHHRAPWGENEHPLHFPRRLIQVQCAFTHMAYASLHTTYVLNGDRQRALDLERQICDYSMGGVETKVLRKSPLSLRLKSLVSKLARAEAHSWTAMREQINFSRCQCLSLISFEQRPDPAALMTAMTTPRRRNRQHVNAVQEIVEENVEIEAALTL